MAFKRFRVIVSNANPDSDLGEFLYFNDCDALTTARGIADLTVKEYREDGIKAVAVIYDAQQECIVKTYC